MVIGLRRRKVVVVRCSGANVDNVVRFGRVEAVGWRRGMSEVVLGGCGSVAKVAGGTNTFRGG